MSARVANDRCISRGERVSFSIASTTYSFAITRQMFDFMEARLEEPNEEETLLLDGHIS